MKIIAATHNKDKIREIRQILADAGICIVSMSAGLMRWTSKGSAFRERDAQSRRGHPPDRIAALPTILACASMRLRGLRYLFRTLRRTGADTRATMRSPRSDARCSEAERTGRYVSAVALAYPVDASSSGGNAKGEFCSRENSGGFGYDTLFAPEDRSGRLPRCRQRKTASAREAGRSHSCRTH